MKTKRVMILGGGVTGLALRYYLSQRNPDLEIILLEKEKRLGGVIESLHADGFFFEKGPRTFKASKCDHLLRLIQSLQMEKELLVSEPKAACRFLWKQGQLHTIPTHPLPLLTSPLTRQLLPALMKEWKQKRCDGDESIHSFVTRRLGIYAAEMFFDPMTLGIYAGDIRKLSVLSCFPSLKELETNHGSLTKGLFKKLRNKKESFSYPKGVSSSSLFTLKTGVESLVTHLTAKGRGAIHLGTAAEKVELKEGKVHVTSGDVTWEVDHLFCALSAKGACHLTKGWDKSVQAYFQNLEKASLSVVHLGFSTQQLKAKGFGYLIPTSEKEKILGVIFDSSVFPEQNGNPDETRLTVMMGGAHHPQHHTTSKESRLAEALEGLRTHLGIKVAPACTYVSEYIDQIPQFTVGHTERTRQFENIVQKKYPQITFLGNYLKGVSISDCIAKAEEDSFRYKPNI